MDNYIVRIYRREGKDPRVLVGFVEEVGVQGKRAFNDLDDLWEILISSRQCPDGRPTKGHQMKRTSDEEAGKKKRRGRYR